MFKILIKFFQRSPKKLLQVSVWSWVLPKQLILLRITVPFTVLLFPLQIQLPKSHCNNLLHDYILITNLMHQLLFIHKIIFPSTCFEPQVFIFRKIQLYTCSIRYCHSLWEFLVACRYTAWVRTDCWGKVVGGCLKTPTNSQFSLKLCTNRPPGTLIH